MHTFTEVLHSIGYYLDRLFSGLPLKAAIAAVPALLASHFAIDWLLFQIWFILNAADLALGVVLAVAEDRFSRRRLYSWIVKVLTHTSSILLVGTITVALTRTSGVSVPVVDWFIFVLILTEATSIIDSAGKLGLPIPDTAKVIVRNLRAKTKTRIDDLTKGAGKNDDCIK